MKKISLTLSALLLAIGLGNTAMADDERVFELRTYTTHEGKLPALLERFDNHTRWLFEKHGMMNLAYWTPVDPELKENTLTYILVHPSLQAAETNWKAFGSDPEWQAVYKKSREDGPIVKHIDSTFLTPTEFSRIR
ncbi:NIPSNAP family protein [Marinimicrobium sp. ARAG 43.8]|uniref:NIPSNAP family protein n=1 Tax=Marinimicrobium sp. ARAG 43.8 TaxID=3418719 RepID=UPI003CE77ABC